MYRLQAAFQVCPRLQVCRIADWYHIVQNRCRGCLASPVVTIPPCLSLCRSPIVRADAWRADIGSLLQTPWTHSAVLPLAQVPPRGQPWAGKLSSSPPKHSRDVEAKLTSTTLHTVTPAHVACAALLLKVCHLLQLHQTPVVHLAWSAIRILLG